jgi:signal transduction histidine kinase
MEAFADMTAPSTSFVDRDLYIFVIGPDHRIVAHAADAARVGVDAQTLVDTDGKPFGNEMIAYATEDGAWVDYKFADPLTGADEPKSSWVVRHGGYIFGCGIYKNATMPDAES